MAENRVTKSGNGLSIQVSHPNPKHSVALLEESARICRLSHPNLARIVAVSQLSFAVLRPAVAVEWLAGGNLADYFRHQIRVRKWRRRWLSYGIDNSIACFQEREERERPLVLLRDILELLVQVSAALKYFHEVLGDVAHGAVTTENVQLTSRDLRR